MSRYIAWEKVNETGRWVETMNAHKLVSPIVGDFVDSLVSDEGWRAALNRRNLDATPIFGDETVYNVIALCHVKSQSKIILKGFKERNKRKW